MADLLNFNSDRELEFAPGAGIQREPRSRVRPPRRRVPRVRVPDLRRPRDGGREAMQRVRDRVRRRLEGQWTACSDGSGQDGPGASEAPGEPRATPRDGDVLRVLRREGEAHGYLLLELWCSRERRLRSREAAFPEGRVRHA